MQTINPATGERIDDYPELSDSQIEDALKDASRRAAQWRGSSIGERAELLFQLAAGLNARKEQLTDLMVTEMGKIRKQGIAEIEKCVWVCEHYAENGERALAEIPIETDASESFVAFQPLGVVLAVMPWNFPYWQVLRFAAPAIMAGNVALLKHSSNVSGCALAIEELFESTSTRGLLQTLIIPNEKVAGIIGDERVAAVTLTGSEAAGRAVAAEAGRALKKTVLELGGSDPYVVLEDCDLEKTVETCVTSRLINSGQSCIAAKRFIVHASIYEEFLERMVELMDGKTIGDPSGEVDVGPLARDDLRDKLAEQVRDSIARGAKVALDGGPMDKAGAWFEPMVLRDCAPGMPAMDEELFGPVAAVCSASDEEEALRLANATSFGLGAAVFTGDIERGRRIAKSGLQAGACFVNAFVKSDPRMPFGGIKNSGHGRELGTFGIREFVNVKSVYVA